MQSAKRRVLPRGMEAAAATDPCSVKKGSFDRAPAQSIGDEPNPFARLPKKGMNSRNVIVVPLFGG